ncbi:hypothetical protein HPB47_028381 [Ixodes persulcatus]|uniref:Uncharacterized protein n=1 Tax=Ixodes persulcatus TaxID=34615 RepID=A0AC60PV40_IXOPE|nr:hypothetical protein HPB47_028381 [Ixodes persulcatus]
MYAISAYYPAADHGKGVIQQVPIEGDELTVLENLMASGYNTLITAARWLGKSETVLIIFENRKLPHFAFNKGSGSAAIYARIECKFASYATGPGIDLTSAPHRK